MMSKDWRFFPHVFRILPIHGFLDLYGKFVGKYTLRLVPLTNNDSKSLHGVSGVPTSPRNMSPKKSCEKKWPGVVHWKIQNIGPRTTYSIGLSKVSLVELAGANHPQAIVSFARYLGGKWPFFAHFAHHQPVKLSHPKNHWKSNLGKHGK